MARNPDIDCYDKPIWTLGRLLSVLPGMAGHLLRVAPTVGNRVLTNAFRERIMVAVAAANRCRYCETAHTAFGKMSGLTDDEIRKLMRGDDSDLPEGEQLALRFARDLAVRNFESRDEELYQRLGDHFSGAQRAAIESTAHVMNFANRFGNTFDAALARLSGNCEQTGAGTADVALVSALFLCAGAAMGPFIGALMVLQKLR